MKIGLVRHFKVDHPFPKGKWLTKSEVMEWFALYDSTESIVYKEVDLQNIAWKRCFASPMTRAIRTANYIFKGEIVEKSELKELDLLHRLSDKLKLPFLWWGLIVRIESLLPGQDTAKFKNGINAVVGQIMENREGDTLIVSHWFVMRVIRDELMKRGFVGSKIKSSDYGILYVFEKH